MQSGVVKDAVGLRRQLEPIRQLSGHTPTQPSPIEGEGEMICDLAHDGGDVIRDLIVREPNDPIALALQPFRSHLIAGGNVGDPLVNAAVDLDDQLGAVDREVSDIWTDRGLSTDVEAKLAQLTPQTLFGYAHGLTKATRA
jgi:hypothetical protein